MRGISLDRLNHPDTDKIEGFETIHVGQLLISASIAGYLNFALSNFNRLHQRTSILAAFAGRKGIFQNRRRDQSILHFFRYIPFTCVQPHRVTCDPPNTFRCRTQHA